MILLRHKCDITTCDFNKIHPINYCHAKSMGLGSLTWQEQNPPSSSETPSYLWIALAACQPINGMSVPR